MNVKVDEGRGHLFLVRGLLEKYAAEADWTG
jgi:hypothetical protein